MSQEKDQEFIFKKLDGKWRIYGPVGYHNQEIDVRKKNGTVEKKQLGNVVSDGMVYYEIIQDQNSKPNYPETIPAPENANVFRKDGDTFFVEVRDGEIYEVGDPILVHTSKKGEQTYKVKAIEDGRVFVENKFNK